MRVPRAVVEHPPAGGPWRSSALGDPRAAGGRTSSRAEKKRGPFFPPGSPAPVERDQGGRLRLRRHWAPRGSPSTTPSTGRAHERRVLCRHDLGRREHTTWLHTGTANSAAQRHLHRGESRPAAMNHLAGSRAAAPAAADEGGPGMGEGVPRDGPSTCVSAGPKRLLRARAADGPSHASRRGRKRHERQPGGKDARRGRRASSSASPPRPAAFDSSARSRARGFGHGVAAQEALQIRPAKAAREGRIGSWRGEARQAPAPNPRRAVEARLPVGHDHVRVR